MSSAPSPNSLPPLSYHHTVANSTLPTHLAQSQRQVSRFALVWPSTPLKKSKKIKQKHFAFRLDSFTSSVALPNSLFAAAFQFVFSCFELLLGGMFALSAHTDIKPPESLLHQDLCEPFYRASCVRRSIQAHALCSLLTRLEVYRYRSCVYHSTHGPDD